MTERTSTSFRSLRRYVRSIGIVATAAFCILATDARKVTTRVKAPPADTTEFMSKIKTYPYQISEFERVGDNVNFMAYDKKASSDRETFFVDNGSDVDLSELEIEISYFNSAGKLIHKRTVNLTQEFPAKETRKVDIKSWDKQKSFHYINSVPSSKGSSPYTVRFRILSFLEKPD